MEARMEVRRLGQSGLKISALCLGAMNFGASTADDEAQRIVNQAKDDGVNFIDTSDIYNGGKSEEVTGRTIRAARDWWVLATKGLFPTGEGYNAGGLSRIWVIRAVDRSLQRLNTDYIDVYYLHGDDRETPLPETVRVLGDLMQAGKIRYFGISNFRSWRIAEICRVCDELGVPRPVVSQPLYNIMNRMAETEQFPACAFYGLGVAAYSPLARGILTGKYLAGADFPSDSRGARADKRFLQTENRAESMELAQRVKAQAESHGINPTQFAIRWVLNNRFVTCAIAGPRTLDQWSEYVAAMRYELQPEDEVFVDELVAPGHPSTPGYTDPMYPVEGREPRYRS